MNITEDFIIHFTGNASTVANGRGLAAKGSFEGLFVSDDGTLLFGSCKGSGKTPYLCSVDFADPEKPVPRCSCPSRQIPCKHAAGLLYCKVQGKEFKTAEVPEDIAAKRSKIQQREEKKAAKEAEDPGPKEMTKAKASAAAKKCRTQLEGIALAEKILHNIVLAGLHSVDRKNEKLYGEQVKELGNYYIGGIQAAMTDLLIQASEAQKNQDFTDAVGSINYLYALLKKSRTYTESKAADFEAFPQTPNTAEDAMLNSSIEEQMGYAWKLAELREKGRYAENAELLQVGFSVFEDQAKKQFTDEGIWISLGTGDIYLTENFRPFRAQKYVREEDSFFPVLTTSALYIYPGDRNPRVRWEKSEHRETEKADLLKARDRGAGNFAEVIKAVKNQIKSPLADKRPIFALKIARLGQDGKGTLYIVDEAGTSIPLNPEDFGFLMKKLTREQAEGQTLVCRFSQDMKTDLLYAVPVALITGDELIRFTY
ncbi:SWIM zinc finger family protein [Breznakiella homolactica]|uniref:SWIM zinc finger family protein n=1 Tax=Breznakiella homolactica TaxID=2798577 RepID=A0A7T8BAY1_9SPIR|nr:SWIM zinc finger family protein [Breznakiella homolactica]QQO09962.1 SWIM zinc finger domain-containing protein [Breznakiella homolactica]